MLTFPQLYLGAASIIPHFAARGRRTWNALRAWARGGGGAARPSHFAMGIAVAASCSRSARGTSAAGRAIAAFFPFGAGRQLRNRLVQRWGGLFNGRPFTARQPAAGRRAGRRSQRTRLRREGHGQACRHPCLLGWGISRRAEKTCFRVPNLKGRPFVALAALVMAYTVRAGGSWRATPSGRSAGRFSRRGGAISTPRLGFTTITAPAMNPLSPARALLGKQPASRSGPRKLVLFRSPRSVRWLAAGAAFLLAGFLSPNAVSRSGLAVWCLAGLALLAGRAAVGPRSRAAFGSFDRRLQRFVSPDIPPGAPRPENYLRGFSFTGRRMPQTVRQQGKTCFLWVQYYRRETIWGDPDRGSCVGIPNPEAYQAAERAWRDAHSVSRDRLRQGAVRRHVKARWG